MGTTQYKKGRQGTGMVPMGMVSLERREVFIEGEVSEGWMGVPHVDWAGECISNREKALKMG